MTDHLNIPVVPEMIHRADNPAHMMRIRPARREVIVEHDGEILARTTKALAVMEIGRDVYDPVYYVPLDDVTALLELSEKTTHCPLKGDTEYRDLPAHQGRAGAKDIGWVYARPLPAAEALRALIAFDPTRTRIVLGPIS